MNQGSPFLLLPTTFKLIPDFGFHKECLLQGVGASRTRFVRVCSFAGYIPRKGTAGARVGLCWTTADLASVEGFIYSSLHSPQVCPGAPSTAHFNKCHP